MKEFLAQRAALIEKATPGTDAAGALCELTDAAVRDLSRAAASKLQDRWAVVALGGWGSRGLLPGSDLDILVLSDAPEDRLKPFVEAVLYPLWDAGLKVGHQVRSPRQQLAAMRSDLKSCTAALSGRPIAGDVDWAKTAVSSWISDAHRRRRKLVAALHDRPRPGSPFLLEVNLKEDVGGRRDFDELLWTATVLRGRADTGLLTLVDNDVLTEAEVAALREAAETIAATRWRLHSGGHGDELAHDGAALLGESAESVHLAMADTALILDRARSRIVGCRDAPVTRDGAMSAPEVFAALDAGTASLALLEQAATAGRLDHLVFGMRELMGTRRPGLGHRLTVGAHCLYAATLLQQPDGDRALEASLRSLDDPRTLQVATLVHDAAKRVGGAGHAERGAASAAEAAERFGLDAGQAQTASELVRLHLALVETATREDLDDEDAILRCAARIGRRDLVAPLHLLTAADSRATGPATWTPWMSRMLGTLVARVDSALSPDVDGAGVAAHGEMVRASALAGMRHSLDSERAFVEAAPLRYLASRDASEVVRDAGLVSGLGIAPEGSTVRVAVADGAIEGTHTITAVAFDRPELLARLAGALALAGLDILSVDAYGATGRVALDSFVVRSATGAVVRPSSLESIAELAESALEDRLELAKRLAERRRHYPTRSTTSTRVEVAPSGWDTTVVVEAPDRPGLLHDLAAAISSVGLDIRWARAQTLGGVARDTFHVVGSDDGPVDDPGVLGHLAMRLREAL